MADTDGHIGTLLANLQSMRHLTTLESRLLQISDEYTLLREFTAHQGPANQTDMSQLISHLKEQLVMSHVPIPDPLAIEFQQGSFGLELLTQQFEELVAQLKQSQIGSQAQRDILKKLDELIFTEAAAASVCALGVLDEAIKAIENAEVGKNLKHWLHLLTVLTAFHAGRTHPKKDEIMSLAVTHLLAKEVALQQMGVWILANFSDATSAAEQALLGQKMLVHLVPIIKTPKTDVLLHHALRCLTNLATDSANRKVIDAWFGIDTIAHHIDSPIEAIQQQALWCLSHLASSELSASFEKSTKLITKIANIIKQQTTSLDLQAAAWRFLSNLTWHPDLRAHMVSQGIFEFSQQVILSELEEIEADQERNLTMLQEAVASLANLLAREDQLREAVCPPLIQNLVRLLSCNSATVRAQAVWALVYLSVNDKNHPRIAQENSLELALDMLDGEEQEQHAAAWLICNYASNIEFHDRLREIGAIISLVRLLFSKNLDIRLVAGKSLSRLSANNKNKTLVRQLFSTLSQKDDAIMNKATSGPISPKSS